MKGNNMTGKTGIEEIMDSVYEQNGTLLKDETGTWLVTKVGTAIDGSKLFITLSGTPPKPLPKEGMWVQIKVLGK